MARWDPDSRGRLTEAAMALFGERGYENTTVAEIASRARLTERTFFRQFADKREVLFAGSEALRERMVSAVASAPDSVPPIEAIAMGVNAAGALLEEVRSRDFARRRQALIAANAELQERELNKLASMSAGLAEALRLRGVSDASAAVAADVGIAIFRTSFERWIDEANESGFAQLVRESVDELKALTAGG